jgi:type IV pilus assembly protein PilF
VTRILKAFLPGLIALLLSACANTTNGYMHTYSPKTPEARQTAALGLQFLHAGQTALARENMNEALEEAPSDPLVLDAYAFYLEKVGDLRAANSYYLAALIQKPDSGTLRNNYGSFLCRNGYYSQSLPFLLSASDTPHYPGSDYALANARFCAEHMRPGLGDQSEYAYYTQILWAPELGYKNR